MKQLFLVLLTFFVLISCKKEKNTAPESTPAVPQTPSYTGETESALRLNYNSGTYDTVFLFGSRYYKTLGSSTTLNHFTSANLNGYVADASTDFYKEVLTAPNFMSLASQCTWSITSSEYGNFQYSNNSLIPKFMPTSNVVAMTFTASQGLPINVSGISDADYVKIGYDCDGMCSLSGDLKTYQISGNTNIVDTIKDNMFYSIPLNNPVTFYIILGNSFTINLNGHTTYFMKTTLYNYPITRKN